MFERLPNRLSLLEVLFSVFKALQKDNPSCRLELVNNLEDHLASVLEHSLSVEHSNVLVLCKACQLLSHLLREAPHSAIIVRLSKKPCCLVWPYREYGYPSLKDLRDSFFYAPTSSLFRGLV